MTTVSFPVVGANITHTVWRTMLEGQDGIFDSLGTSATDLRLTLSGTSDTATVGLGTVRLRGFVLEVTAVHALTLAPATTAARTYTVGVMYTPTDEAAPGGPLALYSADRTAIVTPAGGSYLALFEVARQPSQVLSLATVTDLRKYVGPSMYAKALPATAPVGAQCFDGADLYARVPNAGATGAVWSNLSSPAWTALTMPTALRAHGNGPEYVKTLGWVQVRGGVERTNGAVLLAPGTPVTLGKLPVGFRPGNNTPFAVASGANAARVDVNSDGDVVASSNDNTSFVYLNNIRFEAEG